MRPLVSLCMIVKNESEVLGRCLESVKDHIQDIVIVDTGSTDNTKEIARKYTEKVFDFEWNHDFSAPRNYAASKAEGEWILVLDADEYVEPTNLLQMMDQLREDGDQYDYYAVNILNFIGNSGEATAQNRHARIYKNNGRIVYFRSIHEQLKAADDTPLKIGLSKLLIYHSGYMNRRIKEKDKQTRNRQLIDKELASKETGFDLFNYGNELSLGGDYEAALEAYIKAFNKKGDIHLEWVSVCLANMVECLIALRRYNDALAVLKDAELLYEQSADFKYLKASVYALQNRFEEAEQTLHQLLQNKDKLDHVIRSQDYREYYPYKLLGSIYEQRKDFEQAVHYYIQAINYNPYCLESITHVIHILLQQHSYDETYPFVQDNLLSKINNQDMLIKILVGVANNGWVDFAQRLADHYFAAGSYEVRCFRLKKDLAVPGNAKGYTKADVLRGVKTGILDLIDLSLLYLENPNEYGWLKEVLANTREFSLGDLLDIVKEEQPMIHTNIVFLIDRCISYKKFETIDYIINKLSNTNLLGPELLSKLGHLFYMRGFKQIAFSFYQQLDTKSYDLDSFDIIIREFIDINELEEALKFVMLAVESGKYDYRILNHGIQIAERLEITGVKKGLEGMMRENFLY